MSKVTKTQLVSRIASHLRNIKFSNVAKAVEETLSEVGSLGDAFDAGNWSLASIVMSVESVLQEDGLC